MVTTCQGMSFPLFCRAFFTAYSSPPQQGTSMLLNVCTEFPYQRFVVFRNSLDTNELAKKAAAEKPDAV